MAYDTALFIQKGTGKRANAPVGFSWTVLFFGFYVPLLRRDFKNAGIIFLALIVSSLLFPLSIVALIYLSYVYNKFYVEKLINDGYRFERTESGRLVEELEATLEIQIPVEEAQAGSA